MNLIKTMIALLLLFSTQSWQGLNAKIYDCFLFFNELEILEIRLNELYDVVDKFVILESTETFRGNPKPLYFQENFQRFEKFADKIIHIVLEDRLETDNPWVREFYQRNQLVRGLTRCQPDDIILISDLDEIVRATTLPIIVDKLLREKVDPIVLEQPMYRFYLNARDYYCVWPGTCATTYKHLQQTTPNTLRWHRVKCGTPDHAYPVISNAGWHFTSMGGLERYAQKLSSYAHAEDDNPEKKSQDAVTWYMNTYCKIVPIDETYPHFVIENEDYFRALGYIYEEN